jgi:hypothetical protein
MVMSFLVTSLICLVLIIISTMIFYEILARVWIYLPRLEGRPELQIILSIVAAFIGHTVIIWMFGITYYLLAHYGGFGALEGSHQQHFMDYIYFSGVAYSSLGLGDIYPTGDLRLMIAVEAILGLVMIGWTITITYFTTEKYFMHKKEHHTRGKK